MVYGCQAVKLCFVLASHEIKGNGRILGLGIERDREGEQRDPNQTLSPQQ